jgi:Na+-driven multidrug efflux pump
MSPLDGPPYLLMFYLNGIEERTYCMIVSFIALVVIGVPLIYIMAIGLNW